MLSAAKHDVLFYPRCVVPEGDGVIWGLLSRQTYGENTTRLRPHRAGPPAPCPARYRTRPRAGHPLRPWPAGGGQMGRPGPDGSGRARPRTRLRGAHPGGRSRHRLVALAPRRLPLGACLSAPRAGVPPLRRPALHCRFRRHGLGRLSPDGGGRLAPPRPGSGVAPHEFLCAEGRKKPGNFIRDPADLTPRPYS